ncbi:hypothetical protein E3N88_12817 [Mikania micrantha]|uniref:Uncharacterized protein n=1 Tax=Mikania micrantha TaxID=192012 RepID=A0A5N6P7W2_9ASTR|nr:hypothetical protein E3N88_12817 [Mikania micrantha]
MVAVGVVTAIGEGVCELKIGDIVYRNAMGTYTEEQIVLADKEMPLPPIDPLVVASVMIQAHTWFKDVMVDPCVADDGYIRSQADR